MAKHRVLVMYGSKCLADEMVEGSVQINIDPFTLDDETDEGHPLSYPSTVGEFAYRWNRWSPERRQQWLAQAIRLSEQQSR